MSPPRFALALALATSLLLAGGLGGAACSGAGPADPPAGPLNLLLLVSDTLRADALECYGGPARTPHLCGLAESGVLFENAYSNGSWTLPSTVALFTGQYPTVFAREAGTFEDKNDFFYVGEEEQLLGEALRERGYETIAFVENPMARKANALQGFEVIAMDEVVGFDSDLDRELGVDVRDLRYLRILPPVHFLRGVGERPFFAVHWFKDPHAAYEPPRWMVASLPYDPARLPHPIGYYARMASRADPRFDWLDLNELGPEMTPDELEFLKALYWKEVESVDERVGYLLDALDATGLRDRTLVVFTSDHGEGFGEHGKFLHAERWYYQEFVRIPLLLAGPGLASGRREDAPVSLVDLAPTLAELLGVELSGQVQGRSLVPLLRPRAGRVEERAQYLAGTAADEGFAALVDRRYKLLRRNGRDELYDLRADPGEQRDLADERPRVRADLAARLEGQLEENRARREARRHLADPAVLERTERETREALEALGYVE